MTTRRVLHVDDEADIREVVQIALGLEPDFITQSCGSGADAILVASTWLPDIILLDVMMPGLDGPATLKAIRKNPRTVGIPVVFMTARAQSRELDQLHFLGAVGVIAKPFDPMTLAALVKAYMAQPSARLDTMSQEFLQRADRELIEIEKHWCTSADAASKSSSMDKIRSVAHGLAGAGGIFGFAQISVSAAKLERSVTDERKGIGAAEAIGSAIADLASSVRSSGSTVSVAIGSKL